MGVLFRFFRLLFYGDKAWLQLLPAETFENRSEAFPSFYVTDDYVEVERRMTLNLYKEMASPNLWNVLIIHSLGLDHVGHTFGADSPQIRLKLDEIDQIIASITRSLGSTDFALLLLGDHCGKMLNGNHGDNPQRELHVPMVLFKKRISGATRASGATLSKPVLIEQVDVVPTISSLLGLGRLPRWSLGVSFLSEVEADRSVVAASLHRNAKHFVDVLLSTTNPLPRERSEKLMKGLSNCLAETTRFCAAREHGALRSVNDSAVQLVFDDCRMNMRLAQRELVGHSSHYDEEYFLGAILFCTLGLILLVRLSFGPGSFKCPKPDLFNTLVFLHPLLFFSASFIDEEHDFWFLVMPLFITYMAWRDLSEFRRLVGKDFWRSPKWSLLQFVWRERWLLFALVCNRVVAASLSANRRRWRLYGDEKIVDFGWSLTTNTAAGGVRSWLIVGTLWSENAQTVCATLKLLVIRFLYTCRRTRLLPYKGAPAFLGLAAVFALKMPFGVHSVFLERVSQACVVWLFLTRHFCFALPLWVMLVARPRFYHHLLLSWAVGHAVGRIRTRSVDEMAYLLHAAISASFFYTGNSNGIVTIDTAPSYVGLFAAHLPLLGAAQILLNTYMCPIFVVLGWYVHTIEASGCDEEGGGGDWTASWSINWLLFNKKNNNYSLSCNRSTSVTDRISMSIQSDATTKLTLRVFRMLMTLRSGVLVVTLVVVHHFRFRHHMWMVLMPKAVGEMVHFAAVAAVTLGATLMLLAAPDRARDGDVKVTKEGRGGGAILVR